MHASNPRLALILGIPRFVRGLALMIPHDRQFGVDHGEHEDWGQMRGVDFQTWQNPWRPWVGVAAPHSRETTDTKTKTFGYRVGNGLEFRSRTAVFAGALM